MTLNLSYDTDLARVRLAVSAAPAAAEYVIIERSTDQLNWTTVRGASGITLISAAAMVDDYEFAADVTNYYRASYVDTAPVTYVGAGAGASAVNASVTPALPAASPGDLYVAAVSIRNSGAGTVNIPAGWTLMAQSGNVALAGRRAVAGDAAPTFTFAGGVANADTLGRVVAFRNAELQPVTATAATVNASAQDIAYGALTVPQDGCAIVALGWKQDDFTSVATLAGWTEAWELSSTTGDDASMVLDYQIQTTKTNIAAGSFSVTGGAAAISRGIVMALRQADYVTRDSGSITPDLDGVWLKSLARPFLNRKVTVTDWSDITRPTRTGLFDVVGRTTPIAVAEVRGSRRWTLHVKTDTPDEAESMDLLLASGDLQFVHVPADCIVPGGYVAVGDTSQRRLGPRSVKNEFSLPLTEVSAPGADVVGATITWQGVLNLYGSWQALLAAHPTWADLLELIGSPSDIIVS